MKVERSLKRGFVNVQAIRVYPAELGKNINSTVERDEKPTLLVKHTVRQKTGLHEIEVVFLGGHHVEDLAYVKTDPRTWVSWGHLVLSLDQARELSDTLRKILDIHFCPEVRT